jgi:hypothetical protein
MRGVWVNLWKRGGEKMNNVKTIESWLQSNDSEIAQAINDLLIEYQSEVEYLKGYIRNECNCN